MRLISSTYPRPQPTPTYLLTIIGLYFSIPKMRRSSSPPARQPRKTTAATKGDFHFYRDDDTELSELIDELSGVNDPLPDNTNIPRETRRKG